MYHQYALLCNTPLPPYFTSSFPKYTHALRYDTSMVLLADALDLPMTPADFDKERSTNRPLAYKDFMAQFQSNTTLQVLTSACMSLWKFSYIPLFMRFHIFPFQVWLCFLLFPSLDLVNPPYYLCRKRQSSQIASTLVFTSTRGRYSVIS